MTLDRYMAGRRYWEVSFWVAYLLVTVLANTWVATIDAARNGIELESWEPLLWETTSNFMQGLLIPVILWFDARFPIDPGTWRRNLAAHASFTIVYSLAHVAGMYWLRVGAYIAIGNNDGYWWPHWWQEFGYEYLKDFRSYFFFLAIIYLYRFILRRLQGVAEFLSEGSEGAESVAITDRFLIKKLGREFLVRSENIDYIESAGNYVNLHIEDRVYPLRDTMAGISTRLAEQGFQRVHRSAIVNLERVAEIVSFGTGDGEIRLESDVRVPVSRRYRKELRDRLSQRA